jgi:hypothetical protein
VVQGGRLVVYGRREGADGTLDLKG